MGKMIFECVQTSTPAPDAPSAAIQLVSSTDKVNAVIAVYNGLSYFATNLGNAQDALHQTPPDSLTGQLCVHVSSFLLGVFLVTLPGKFIHDLLVQLMGVPVIPARNLGDIKRTLERRK